MVWRLAFGVWGWIPDYWQYFVVNKQRILRFNNAKSQTLPMAIGTKQFRRRYLSYGLI